MFPAINISIAMIISLDIIVFILLRCKSRNKKPYPPYRHYRLKYPNYGFASVAECRSAHMRTAYSTNEDSGTAHPLRAERFRCHTFIFRYAYSLSHPAASAIFPAMKVLSILPVKASAPAPMANTGT